MMCVDSKGEQANGLHEQKQRLTLCYVQCSLGFCDSEAPFEVNVGGIKEMNISVC